MARARRLAHLVTTLVVAGGVGCSPRATPPTAPSSPAPSASATPTTPSAPTSTASVAPRLPDPRRAFLTIARLGLREHPVLRYRGSPDDAEGTRLQNEGSLASPRGAGGGTGPGEIGNYIVTGHRLSSTAPFRQLPALPNGSRVQIRVGDVVHVYEVRRTRRTSFRSRASLAAQRAPVPGRPGVDATVSRITLSTCATIEDHAAGNFWADEFDNPEHRIDKIGVLVASRAAS